MTKWEKAAIINAMASHIDEEKSKEIAEFAISIHQSELRENGEELMSEWWEGVKENLKKCD